MDNPLLSYIDVRHPHFLPPNLTVGEARDLGPQYTTAKDLTLMRDASAKQASQNRRVHMPVKEPNAPIQVAESVTTNPINSLKAKLTKGKKW